MEQQKRELPETATLADMKSVCDDLAAQGYLVHIEYNQAEKKITVYGEGETAEQKFLKEVGNNFLILYSKKLKEQYAILAAHPPAPQGKKWNDYQALMQGLERQLLEAGVQL